MHVGRFLRHRFEKVNTCLAKAFNECWRAELIKWSVSKQSDRRNPEKLFVTLNADIDQGVTG